MAKWRKVKLADVCKFVRGPFGGSLKKDIFVSQGYAVFEQQHAIYGDFNKFRYFVTKDKFNEMQRFKLSPGDLIMSCSGTLGKVALVPEGIPNGIINQALLKLTPTDEVEGSYIKSWFESDLFTQSLRQNSGGAAIQNVAEVRLLKEIEIPLPPLAEQRKIAEIIRTWDEAIEAAEAELKAKQERKRWQLQHALTQASKEVKRLNATGHYFHPLSERNSEGLAPLSVTQDAGVVLRSDMTRRISYDEDTLGTYKVVRPNNFIISLRSFEGGIEMSDVTGCVSPAYQVFGPNPGVNFRYFRHYFKSQDFIKRLAVTVFGIRDGKQISYSHFSEVKIPVLTDDAQEQLADVADATELDIKLSLERLSKLREQKRGLMQKLLTGEVRVAA